MISKNILVLIEAIENIFIGEENSLQAYHKFTGWTSEQIEKIQDSSELKSSLSIDLKPIEWMILIAVAAPHLYQETYSRFKFLKNTDSNNFGGLGGKVHQETQVYYPTIETILYLVNGKRIAGRVEAMEVLRPGSPLLKSNLIRTTGNLPELSDSSQQLYPGEELLSVLRREPYQPTYSSNFPATPISTQLNWEDLVLPYETLDGLEELKLWMEHREALEEDQEIFRKIKPGYRVLFYGPSGTGKTLTASLIGKHFNIPVYRVDLSMVVSKWVGETEKNLKNLFDIAENKNWILFFDEADSIFGKRTQTNSSNDKYANQEVAYLLQRIEDYPGMIILATNLKSNIDAAFNRRFQATITFPAPDEEMRYQLWEKAFPKGYEYDDEIDLWDIARSYEVTGGIISNITRYCILKSMNRQTSKIRYKDLKFAIVREFRKSGKSVK
ncbi:ATP-binding protein [Persicobacter diffluens]|uniref:AAA+ ATPase domain-containing protein n=1 Tax=Persicobacter diffluens TaxID=981 RepID=A0AAN5AQ44_9BACT|nr:hypothetical protein PEDI_54830 [Persicobacter diffluens]